MLLTRTSVRREPCRRCKILRMFLVMVLMVITIGFVAADRLHPLGAIGPYGFGFIFCGLAGGLFVLKFWLWKQQKNKDS